MDGDHVLLHHILDQIVIVRQQQILDGGYADKAVVVVVYIAGVDSFLVDTRAADSLDSHFGGHIRPQRNELCRHDRACAVLGILEQLVYLPPCFLVSLSENTLDDVRWHLLDKVNRVVDKQLVNDLLQLVVTEAVNQELLSVLVHLDEGFRRQFLWQNTE